MGNIVIPDIETGGRIGKGWFVIRTQFDWSAESTSACIVGWIPLGIILEQ